MKIRDIKNKLRVFAPLGMLVLMALVVAGAVAIFALLRHYRANDLAEQRRQAELRDATAAARARLTADAMGMLFSDVQNALATTLNAVPREGTLSFLKRWREVNPLVSTALLVNAQGALVPGKHWPAEMLREYHEALRAPDGFLQKNAISPSLVNWLAKTLWHPGAVAEKPPLPATPPDTALAWESLREKLRAAATRDPYSVRDNPAASAFPDPVSTSAAGNLPSGDDYTGVEPWPERRRRLGIPFVERTGWDAAPGGLYAWRMCDDDIVLVASVDLQKLAALLAGALPPHTEGDTDYNLLADNGAAGVPAITSTTAQDGFSRDFPIHPELLPGWVVRTARKQVPGVEVSHGAILYNATVAAVILAAGMAILLLFILWRWMCENEKNAFVADFASHEIRNLVQKISCYSSKSASDVESAAMLRNSSQHLLETTKFVLDFSPKVIHGRKIRTKEVNLSQATEALLEEFRSRLRDRADMELVVNLPEAPVRAKTDEIVVSIILQNLLYNAELYAATGGRVDVSLAENPAARTTELRVRDYGPGVPRRECQRIFKHRRRFDEREHGHGIGLPFSRALARATGGDLICEIPADGDGGSIFILSLPNIPPSIESEQNPLSLLRPCQHSIPKQV